MLYYTFLLIVSLDFAWTQYLAYRNRKRMSTHIPEKLVGIYNQEKYEKQQAYQKANSRMTLLSASISFVLFIITLFIDGFGGLDQLLRMCFDNPILISLLFVGVLYTGNLILSLPFSYYDKFVIENKYGFNNSTRMLFWLDQLKSMLLSVVLGGTILSLLVWFYNSLGSYAWLCAWGLVTAFVLFMTFFYSHIIVPLFNKQTPLEEGELRQAIEKFSTRAGFELNNIYVMDASKRSTKGNAYFTGLGSKKRIVLFDTLINDLSTDEIVAVLAHEIGHYKKKHITQNLFGSIAYTGILLFILSFVLSSTNLAMALGGKVPSFHLGIIAFSILFTPISLLLGILRNRLSRKNEYEADAYAASFGLGNSLISGLKKLSVDALSNLDPDPWNVFIYYSHPTLLQRIERLKKTDQNKTTS